jgi:TIR domain
MLFLSYATEDAEVARGVGRSLASRGFEPYLWQDHRGGQFIQRIEAAIERSDAFLALLSPRFMRSAWCRSEEGMAIQREQELRATGKDGDFVHVLHLGGMAPATSGFLGTYDWVDLTGGWPAADEALSELAGRLRSVQPAGPVPAGGSRLGSPLFCNRRDEVAAVMGGLTNSGGPHFWLITAPPQLGKSWLLRQISDRMTARPENDWVTRLVDLHRQPLGVRADPGAILGLLFGHDDGTAIGPDAFPGIAREISRGGKSYLCLLDSAELLSQDTAGTLRRWLSEIYQLVEKAGKINVRLGLIVAARRDAEWRGIAPPRIAPLPLTPFTVGVVRNALERLAQETDHVGFSPDRYMQIAESVHRLSEGLPALLVRCLQWIRAQEWLELDLELEGQELFEKLAWPYLKTALLSPDSLMPRSEQQPQEEQDVLEQALQILAPYRLFTQSHLRRHLESDPVFVAALRAADWSDEDLWRAISDTALLARPLDEPWQEINAPIRRLLYRYFYKSSRDRAEVNRAAGGFIQVWADKQVGKEQVIGLVEGLWHQVSDPLLGESGPLEATLTESARKLSQALRPSAAYTVPELRRYAVERMKNDEEFQAAISHVPGLFDRLTEAVAAPQEP